MAARLTAKSVLITGCNRGVGLELVKQFLQLPSPPVHIFATCRTPDKADELQQISKDNPSVKILKLDVEDSTTIESTAVQVEQLLGESGLNLLINNAGVGYSVADAAGVIYPPDATTEDTSAELMLKLYYVNTIGPLLVTKRLLPLIRKAAQSCDGDGMSASRAAIMNMSSRKSSIDDNRSGKSYSYRCSKIALNMISKNLSIELAPDKILVASLDPGWVKTDMGGSDARLTTEQSAKGLLDVMATRTKEHSGLFYDYKGLQLPW